MSVQPQCLVSSVAAKLAQRRHPTIAVIKLPAQNTKEIAPHPAARTLGLK
jgi:hypothetical protein